MYCFLVRCQGCPRSSRLPGLSGRSVRRWLSSQGWRRKWKSKIVQQKQTNEKEIEIERVRKLTNLNIITFNSTTTATTIAATTTATTTTKTMRTTTITQNIVDPRGRESLL